MKARAVMALGCTSDAGKSWIATALCRWYARQGYVVRPFKAQNMSNHARVVARPEGGWGEIGSAQYFQALAAGARPEVRMNPVLLKPEADTRSQVVVMGEVRHELAALPWRERSALLRAEANAALASLQRECEVLVIEGAGSPAEINLAASDYVNTGTALAAEAACLLISDIDRGGAFAHLYGTWALMDERVRAQVRGFLLNKFRGDASLLAPAPEQLLALTGVPTLGVVPLLRQHGLPEEDAVPRAQAAGAGARIVVLAGPHASNLDEFAPLAAAGLALEFSRDPQTVAQADWLILPGSKNTRGDLAWLRSAGLDRVVGEFAASGKPLLGICGGMQMLGERVLDPLGLEGGAAGETPGLGLLPIVTELAPAKSLVRRDYRFAPLHGPWAALSGIRFEGYEIHAGQSRASAALTPALEGEGLGWTQGNVLGIYPHGALESAALLQALFGVAPPTQETFDRLADALEAACGREALLSLLAPRA